MSKVYVKLPKTGLGNLMLVWSRACVFAHLNKLPLITSSWWAFRWGVWLRNEKKKRLYFGYFKESSWLERIRLRGSKHLTPSVYNPAVVTLSETEAGENNLYVFSRLIADKDLFGPIRSHRAFVREQLYWMIKPKLLRQLATFEPPVISVHIRRGDFKLGKFLTKSDFYTDCINKIRIESEQILPVTIFTDGNHDDIAEVLSLPNTFLSPSKPDILDILLMSQSKIIIISEGSTFSYWAAFLSEAVIIKPLHDWQTTLRSEEITAEYPEIVWKSGDQECTDLLRKSLRNLKM